MILGAAVVALTALPGTVAFADTYSSTALNQGPGSFPAEVGSDSVSADPLSAAPMNNTLAVDRDQVFAVGTKSESTSLNVYSVANGHKLFDLPGYKAPRNVIFSPDGTTFTVTDSVLGVVDRIEVEHSSSDPRKIERLTLEPGAFGSAQSSDGNWLYVNNYSMNTVTKVNLHSADGSMQVDPNFDGSRFEQPRQGIKLSTDNKTLYVTNYVDGKESKIIVTDAATGKMRREITGYENDGKGLPGLRGLTVGKDRKEVYVATSGDDSVRVISVADADFGTELARFTVGDDPYGAVVSPEGNTILTGNKDSNSVSIINLSSKTVSAPLTDAKLNGPRQAIVFKRDSQFAWVLNEDLTLAKIDVVHGKVDQEYPKK